MSSQRPAPSPSPSPATPVHPPRGAPKDPDDPTLARWDDGLPIAIEARGTLADLEADAIYRWAASAVSGGRVLDLGCGPGHGTALLARAAESAVGVDPNLSEIEAAGALYGEVADFHPHPLDDTKLPDASFELIVLVRTAESAPRSSVLVLTECLRLLAPGGVLIAELPHGSDEVDAEIGARVHDGFANVSLHHVHTMLGATVGPVGEDPAPDRASPSWLAGEPGQLRRELAVASDGDLPSLSPEVSLTDFRDLRAFRDLLEAWEQRARQAEAEGSAKHWELVAAREAQRRLRRRLFELEHRPLRTLLRMLKGGPRKVGPGPPIRASEKGPETWD